MASKTFTTGTIASHMGTPVQPRPATARFGVLQGPSYNEETRGHLAGITKPAANNERPFMSWKDEFRSTTGMHTWDPDKSAARGPGYGPLFRTSNYADARVRAAKALRVSMHGAMHFNAQKPGVTPSNPAARYGNRVLSSRFIPLETSGDGLLFIHPNQRDILTWTQEQLREDAKTNGRDIDQELDEKIEGVLQQSPLQPYTDVANQRKMVREWVRHDLIRQEMRLHERRKEQGLPVPPMMFPQFSNEYPDSPGEEPKTPKHLWYYTTQQWSRMPRFGSFRFAWTPDHVNRMKKRQLAYRAELEAQGFKVPALSSPQQYSDGDVYRVAQERAVAKRGIAVQAELVDREEPVYNED
ncbi:hypothetical protein DIPPA_03358 [Diplonema papillatum]|nr:hypothetical protein DIPPA_03358 [Diplonema papillatum]